MGHCGHCGHWAGCRRKPGNLQWDKQWKSRRGCLENFALGRFQGKSDSLPKRPSVGKLPDNPQGFFTVGQTKKIYLAGEVWTYSSFPAGKSDSFIPRLQFLKFKFWLQFLSSFYIYWSGVSSNNFCNTNLWFTHLLNDIQSQLLLTLLALHIFIFLLSTLHPITMKCIELIMHSALPKSNVDIQALLRIQWITIRI